MIDWIKVQRALTRAGYPCGTADGRDGPLTYTSLFAFAAGRQPDDVLRALGKAGGGWLANDAISQTPQRLAEFVAQCANETGGFRRFEENLNYSAEGLCNTWPSHFTPAQAQRCARNPVEIAKLAYGGRMGNAPAPSTDGWDYRGRGMLQLTGRDNYELFGKLVSLPLLTEPDLASDPADSLVIAREFWRRGHVNDAIDRGDYRRARQITNGGAIGLEAVASRRARILEVLNA